MGLGKSFKKAVKKAKKSAKKAANKVADTAKDAGNKVADTAKDAGNKVADTAKDAGNAIVDAANTVSDEVAREAEKARQTVVNLTHDVAEFAEQSYEEAMAAAEDAYNEAMALAERFLNDALSEALEALAEDVYRKHIKLIAQMSEAGYALLSDSSRAGDMKRLAEDSARKRKNEDTHASVRSLASHESVQSTSKEAKDKDFISLSFGFGFGFSGSKALTNGTSEAGGGIDFSAGFAFDVPEARSFAGYIGGGVVAGWSVKDPQYDGLLVTNLPTGVSGGFQMGVWLCKPSKLAGPYFAVGLTAGISDVGGSAQIVFNIPTNEKEFMDIIQGKKNPFAGIVVSCGLGVSTGVCVGGGYTGVF